MATLCHLLDIARGGWLPYTQYALGLNVFEDAFATFFRDPDGNLLAVMSEVRP